LWYAVIRFFKTLDVAARFGLFCSVKVTYPDDMSSAVAIDRVSLFWMPN
jgi:hypothetical protein